MKFYHIEYLVFQQLQSFAHFARTKTSMERIIGYELSRSSSSLTVAPAYATTVENPLLIGHHVVLQHPDPANLYFDGVTGDDVPVGILGAHPDYVAGVEGGVAA